MSGGNDVKRRITYFNRRHRVCTSKQYQHFLSVIAVISQNIVSMKSVVLLVLMELNQKLGNAKELAIVPYGQFFFHTAFWTKWRRMFTQVTIVFQASMTDSKLCDTKKKA